jgi:hypothetical protein
VKGVIKELEVKYLRPLDQGLAIVQKKSDMILDRQNETIKTLDVLLEMTERIYASIRNVAISH